MTVVDFDSRAVSRGTLLANSIAVHELTYGDENRMGEPCAAHGVFGAAKRAYGSSLAEPIFRMHRRGQYATSTTQHFNVASVRAANGLY